MKILAIIGTPTRDAGYTVRTVRAIEESLAPVDDMQMEYLYLEDLNLQRCQGYLTCIKQGEQHCPFSSDVAELTGKMAAADAVIFASPVHCFNVSTLMKNMIDLLVYQMHRPAFFGKQAVIVTTAAGAGQKGVLNYLEKTVSNWGFDVISRLGTHAGLFAEPAYQSKLRRAADRLAVKLIRAVEAKKIPAPGIAELINFRVWRSVIKRSREASPYDWQHWQNSGWLDQPYYFATRVNPVANVLAACVEKLIERAIQKVSVNPAT